MPTGPTATAVPLLRIVTPVSSPEPALVTMLQLAPLKFSTRSVEPVPPTAQTSMGEMAVTALSEPPVAGVVWMLQDAPL